jgi:hypothetical protein
MIILKRFDDVRPVRAARVFEQVVGFPGSVRGSSQTVHRHSGERL